MGATEAARRRSVALLHYTAPPVVGGVEQVLGRQARLMADAGHAVRIVAGRGAAPDGRIAFERLPGADTADPEVVRRQRALDAGRIPARFDADVAALAADLGDALAGADVVVAHNVASLGLNLGLTAALRTIVDGPAGPRTILWHHDLAWLLPAHRPTLHDGYPWDLLRTAWPGVTQVAISDSRRADLAALLGIDEASVAVVPNGVDLVDLLGLEPRTVRLAREAGVLDLAPLALLPARVTPRKNIELALAIVAAMRAAGRRDAGMVVTGPADPHAAGAAGYLGELVDLRRRLGLDGAALFLAEDRHEVVDEVVVRDLYRLADLLLLPSLDEGFGIPILEAGAHRLPIVCSDLPALRDLAGPAALYFAPDDDPAAIAARIIGHLDADPRADLARRVRTEFTWEAVYRRAIAPLLA